MEPQLSKKIGVDDFLFGELLGEGAYSKVVFAQKKDTKENYAVKIVNKNFIKREGKTNSVLSERNALLRFQHPFITKLAYSFQDSCNLYFVIQYCSGGDLASMIKEFSKDGNHCPDSVVRFYASEILATLEYLHSTHKAVHRDIKPENILLQESGHILLTDFGTVLFLEDVIPDLPVEERKRSRGYTFCGSSRYISPEVLDGGIASPASDLWAFGCILYQLYTGDVLFSEENDYLIFEKIAHFSSDSFVFPSIIPGDAQVLLCPPSDDKDLIRQLLQKDPTKRIGSVSYKDLYNHPFFASVDFSSLPSLTPPFHPVPHRLPSLNKEDGDMEEVFEEITLEKGIVPLNAVEMPIQTEGQSKLPLVKSTPLEPLTQINPSVEDVEKRREQAFTDLSALSKGTVSTGKERSNSVKGFNIFLNSSEEVIYNGILKRGRCFSFFNRHLVLTSYPRIFCLNLRNGKLEFNVYLKQVTNVNLLTDSCFSFEDSHSKKTYVFRAIQGDVKMWVKTIKSMMTFYQLFVYCVTMSDEPKEYFFADTIIPGQPLSIALIYRSLKLTNLSFQKLPSTKEITTVNATVEDKTIPIAYLSRKSPQAHVSLDFIPQNMSVTLEITGNTPVDVMGYVHDVDVTGLMNLKKQMGLEETEVTPQPVLSELSFEPFSITDYQRIGDYVRYKDIVVGKGSIPMKGQRVYIQYKMELPNGVSIQSTDPSQKKQLPIKRTVEVAVAKVCPGVDKVLRTMREGGERIAVIRPENGYGDKGHKKAGIPPNCTFLIDIKLVKCLS